MNVPTNIESHGGVPHVPAPHSDNAASVNKLRHEIRTAMHVVTGMSEVLGQSDKLAPAEREIAAMLKRNADRALHLIDDLFQSLEQVDAHREKQ